MSEIKDKVAFIKSEAMSQFRVTRNTEFAKQVEENAEMEMDFKSFENCIEKVEDLIRKYRKAYHSFSRGYYKEDLFNYAQNRYFDSKDQEFQKIRSQFKIIENRLKTIRNADKAIEFLQLCGIEFPSNSKPIQPDSPVDVDFIKSVLPKNVLLGSGESEVNNEQ
jgi:Zn-dependent M32 family carboxypeptidase